MKCPTETDGFTLVETLVVLMLVGVLTSVMAPLFSPGRWRADAAVSELTLALNGAQRAAVLRQHDIVVRFLTDERRIQIHDDADNDGAIDDDESVRLIELPETIGFSQGSVSALPEGNGPVTFRAVEGVPRLTFHRNGSASQSGAAYLRPVEGSLSTSKNAVRAITVVRATGSVQCRSFQTGSWEVGC